MRRPSDPVILREYARFHEVTDNLGGAETILRRALKAYPADLDLKADLGRILCFRCEEVSCSLLPADVRRWCACMLQQCRSSPSIGVVTPP